MIKEIVTGPARGVFLCDLHAPYTRMDVLQAGLKRAKAWLKGGPKDIARVVVVGGDLFDAAALSSYLSPEERAHMDWRAELEASLPVVRAIDGLRGRGVEIHELDGNHEVRQTRRGRGVVDPAFRSALQIDRVCPEIGRIRSKWTRHTYDWENGVVHVGAVAMMHGFACGLPAVEREALRCRLELAKAGKAYPETVTFRGHQHNRIPYGGGGPVPVRCRQVATGVSVLSPGTMGPQRCAWAPEQNDTEWAAGIGLFEVASSGALIHAEVVPL